MKKALCSLCTEICSYFPQDATQHLKTKQSTATRQIEKENVTHNLREAPVRIYSALMESQISRSVEVMIPGLNFAGPTE